MQERRRHARREEAGRAAEQDAQRPQLIDGGVHVLAVDVETGKDIGDAEIWLGHGFPECAQLLNAPFRRIAGDDGCVHGADRDAGDPIRMQVRLRQRLIDAGLICAKSASSLQDQRDALELRPLRGHMGLALRRGANRRRRPLATLNCGKWHRACLRHASVEAKKSKFLRATSRSSSERLIWMLVYTLH